MSDPAVPASTTSTPVPAVALSSVLSSPVIYPAPSRAGFKPELDAAFSARIAEIIRATESRCPSVNVREELKKPSWSLASLFPKYSERHQLDSKGAEVPESGLVKTLEDDNITKENGAGRTITWWGIRKAAAAPSTPGAPSTPAAAAEPASDKQ